MRHFLLLLSSILIFSACENSIVAPNEEILGLQFFPISKDSSDRYSVEEINYNNDGSIDTSFYTLEDIWIDSLSQESDNILSGYRIRIDNQEASKVISTVTKRRSENLAFFRFGNEEELKLSFPVREDKRWNGKPQEVQEDEFQYFKVFQPFTLNDSTFQSSVTVIQEDNQDSVANFDQRIEVYAAGIGLVYKISSQLEFCRETECLGLQQIEFGKTVTMTRQF